MNSQYCGEGGVVGQKGEKGQGVPLSVIEGGREALEQLLVADVFRPNNEPSQWDALAQRLRPRGKLRQVKGDDLSGIGAPTNKQR